MVDDSNLISRRKLLSILSLTTTAATGCIGQDQPTQTTPAGSSTSTPIATQRDTATDTPTDNSSAEELPPNTTENPTTDNPPTDNPHTEEPPADTPEPTQTEEPTSTETATQAPETYQLEIHTLENGQTPSGEPAYNEFYHDPQRIQAQRQQWINDSAWNELVRLMQQDKPINETETESYPNSESPWEYDSHWDLQKFKDTTTLSGLIDWTQPATQNYQQREDVDGGYPSTTNDHMAATIKKITEEKHPDAQIRVAHLDQYGRERNHGTYIVYSSLEDLEGEHHWHLVETVSGEHDPVQEAEQIVGDEYYNPFVEGYTPQNHEFLDYDEVKVEALIGLRTLTATGRDPEDYLNRLSTNDNFEESAYNDTILENEEGDPLFDTLDTAVDRVLETGDYTVVYGSVEDPKIGNGDEYLHNALMNEPVSISDEEIDMYLEGDDQALPVSSASNDSPASRSRLRYSY